MDINNVIVSSNYPLEGTGYQFGGAYEVWIDADTCYIFFPSDPTSSNLTHIYMAKSTDGGKTFSVPQKISADLDPVQYVYGFSVWYDKWTPGINSPFIHILWSMATVNANTNHRLYYCNINPANSDAKSTIYDFGVSISNLRRGPVHVIRSRSGYIYALHWARSTGDKFYCSIDGGITWSSKSTASMGAVNPVNQVQLFPGTADYPNDVFSAYLTTQAGVGLSIGHYSYASDAWSTQAVYTDLTNSIDLKAATRPSDGQTFVACFRQNGAVYDLVVIKVTGSLTWSPLPNAVTGDSLQPGDTQIVLSNDEAISLFYAKATGAYLKRSTDGGANWSSEHTINSLSIQSFGQCRYKPATDIPLPGIVIISTTYLIYSVLVHEANYIMSVTGLRIPYIDEDGDKQLHVVLENLDPTTKNNGEDGEVVIDIGYEVAG